MVKNIRKAKIHDAKQIYELLNYWAKKKKLLARSLSFIYENIRDYWVCEVDKQIVGVCALHILGWEDLGEIKSLAIKKHWQSKGIAKELVNRCLQEAKELGLKKVFTLTFVPDFFKKIGFKLTSRKRLPHKVWADCINCPLFPDCGEKALVRRV